MKSERPPLTEALFVEVFLERKLVEAEARSEYGLYRREYWTLLRTFRGKYAAELKARRSTLAARSKFGNQHGARDTPSQVLDPVDLQTRLNQGLSLAAIGRMYGCSEFLVQQNMLFHGIQRAKRRTLPLLVREHNIHLLERLEAVSPGIMEAAAKSRENPEVFFDSAYAALLDLLPLLWFLQGLGKSYGRAWRRPAQSPVCWSLNQYEARMAIALRDAGIPYARQVALAPGKGQQLVDFLLDGRLVLEIDGEYHKLPVQREADRKKEELVRARGWGILRVPTTAVMRDMGGVMQKVHTALRG